MERRAKIHQLNSNSYCIDDAGDSNSYVVVGNRKAAVIDTANGWEDLQQIVREITDLPLVVIDTHGHCDHVYGNVFFDAAMISPRDIPLHDEHFAMKETQPIREDILARLTEEEIRKYRMAKPCRLIPVMPGEKIDLGGVELEVIDMAGHTKGSIGLLNPADGNLYSGDAVNKGQFWMQLEESLPLEQYVDTLERLEAYRPLIKELHAGHSVTAFEPAFLDVMKAGILEIIATEGREDGTAPWFRGIADSHTLPDGTLILYDKRKIHGR